MTTISVSRPSDGVLVATLDRPASLNALTPEMFDDLAGLAADVEADASVRAVVLTGAGRGFCSGYDLAFARELPTMTAMDMFAIQDRAAAAFTALRSLTVPVIAAINGPAAGGGFALALACDIRVAAPVASFVAAFVKIGLSGGDLGTSWLLPRAVSPSIAAEILLTGRVVDAEEAERIGIVNRIVEQESLLAEAIGIAEQIRSNAPQGVKFTKRSLRHNLETPSFAAALELESRGQALLSRTDDMAEALDAYLGKRDPKFSGR